MRRVCVTMGFAALSPPYELRVSAETARLIIGAASKTNGVMIAQAISHDLSHWLTNIPWARNGALAIAAATAEVNPD